MTVVIFSLLGLAVLWFVLQLRSGWSVVLDEAGPTPIAVIKELRTLAGLNLLEAKQALDRLGVVERGLSYAAAERWVRALRARGALVHLASESPLPRRVRVASWERALVLREGSYERLLAPGLHWIGGGRVLRHVNLHEPLLDRALARLLLADPAAGESLLGVDVALEERAVVWYEERVSAILEPGRHALWRALEPRLERLPVGREGRLVHPHAEALLAAAGPGQIVRFDVDVGQRGYLYRSGVFVDELLPGRHMLWGGFGDLTLRRVEVRPHAVAAARCLAVTTADRVEVEVDLDLELAAEDPRWAAEAARDSTASLIRQAQVLLRAELGQQRVDAILADQGEIGRAVLGSLEGPAERLGWRVCALQVSVVGLPEVLAQAGAQALEVEQAARVERVRRREETAATRSQLNTARMVASCPTLLRLKELDAACAMARSARGVGIGVGAGFPRGLGWARVLGR